MVKINKEKKKTIIKSHEYLTINQSTHLIDKNSRTIMKLCQLIEIKKLGKENDINYDKEGYITKRIEKLKIRINKRLAKLAKWVDMPDHEQLALMPNKIYQTRGTPLISNNLMNGNNNNNNINNNHNNNLNSTSNLLSKNRSKLPPNNKVSNIQQIRHQLPIQHQQHQQYYQQQAPRYPPHPYPHPSPYPNQNIPSSRPPYLQSYGPPIVPGQNYNRNVPVGNFQSGRPLLYSQQSGQPRPIPLPRAMIPPRQMMSGNLPPYPRPITPNNSVEQKSWGLTPGSTTQLSSLMSLQKQIVQTTSSALRTSLPNNIPQLPQSPLLSQVPLPNSSPSLMRDFINASKTCL